MKKRLCTHFKADEKREGHGDKNEKPAKDGQNPSAHSDPRIAIVSCMKEMIAWVNQLNGGQCG